MMYNNIPVIQIKIGKVELRVEKQFSIVDLSMDILKVVSKMRQKQNWVHVVYIVVPLRFYLSHKTENNRSWTPSLSL